MAVRILFDYKLPGRELARLQALQRERDRIDQEREDWLVERMERKVWRQVRKMERQESRKNDKAGSTRARRIKRRKKRQTKH